LFQDRLTSGPILSTLASFAAPNLVALCSSAVITIAETAYVGQIGVAALAGVALVFPAVMLMQMMSAGAMGGAISGAISRALGAGDQARAERLALCAFAIGAVAGIVFAAVVWLGGPYAWQALGGTGANLEAATAYSRIVALAVLGIWLTNTMASIGRGSGHMSVPAMVLLAAGIVQITVGGALAFGIGPFPRLGVEGVAWGQAVAFTLSAVVMLVYLVAPDRRVRLRLDFSLLSKAGLAAILKVGAIAALSPIQSVLTVMILTALVARFGADALAGFGIGSRLEFLLIPVAFSIGIGSVPMVGASIGARNVGRARQVAWTAGLLAAAVLSVIALVVMVAPDLWAGLFTAEGAVRAAADSYLRIASWGFPFFGLALCLYFASQGAGKMVGPIVAQSLRLAIVAAGGWLLVSADAPLWSLFALSAVVMVAQGLATALAVRLSRWG
jgi:putative MATE family efflux protein